MLKYGRKRLNIHFAIAKEGGQDMKFKKLMLYLRAKIGTSNFYEDITFKGNSTELKVRMVKWCDNLQKYKETKINQFKDLLLPLNEIVLPVKINYFFCGRCSLHVEFTDTEGKKYYMVQDNVYDYHKMNTYTIGRRNSKLEPSIDREFTFEILEDEIKLIESGLLRLKEDGTNDEIAVDFKYNKEENVTQATLKSYVTNRTIKIQYPTIDMEFDKDVLEFLLKNNEEHWYYYDVFPILRWISCILEKPICVSIIAEIEKEISSEVDVVKGIVQKYTLSEIVNEGEVHITKKIFCRDLEEFLDTKE